MDAATRLWIFLVCMITPLIATGAEPRPGVDWPGFRGINASGVSEGAPLPAEWNGATGRNIRWKTPIPGLGHSSPVIWGDRVFVTTAVRSAGEDTLQVGLYGNITPVNDETPHAWKLYCLDKQTGSVLWEKTAHEGVPKVKRHTKATHANSTPATDGRHVVAMFGSEGLYCYDINGTLKWKKDLGVLDAGYYMVPAAQWEYGSSPIIHDGRVIVLMDVQNDARLACFNVNDGSLLWETKRDEVPTWGSPSIYESAQGQAIAVNGYKHIGGYDLATGKPIWHMTGGGDIPVPTPVVAHDLIFIANAHGMAAPIYAVRQSATGDITLKREQEANESIAWVDHKYGNYMQTPIVYGDLVYGCRDNGVLNCRDARTGELHYRERIGSGDGYTASPVAGDGKLYFTSETGSIHVIKAGTEFESIAVNTMGEVCMATPAVSEGTIFIRSQHHLFAIEASGEESTDHPSPAP